MQSHSLCLFIEQAVAQSGPHWKLLLQFWPTDDEMEDCSQISQGALWMWRLDNPTRLQGDLRRHGLALVTCESEAEAWKLYRETRGRVSVVVFDPKGRRIQWPHPSYVTPPYEKSTT